MSIDALAAENPTIPWKNYLNELVLSDAKFAIVGQPEFFQTIEKLLNEHPIDDIKTYLHWKELSGSAAFLSKDFRDENFNFYGKELKGQKEQAPRWKTAQGIIDGAIGEDLGKLFVEKYFPPESKEKITGLVDNLLAVYKDRLKQEDWMSDETRQKSIEKLETYTTKVGYPDKFRDYSSLEIKPDDLYGNIQRASEFEMQRRLARIGQPVERAEWAMTPQTVNAYYNPLANEIVFPAGILQPPFFDPKMDDAVNYGSIGAVIGHEITHGFDDEGRHFDGKGNLNDWWTSDDAKKFSERAQKLVDEYNNIEVLPGVHVNGKLTLGENMADLGGLKIAYDALERELDKDPSKRKLIDGFTPEQRFFIAFAQTWRANQRDETVRNQVTSDPHSPDQVRAYAPLVNMPEFYAAFGVEPGDKMWRDPSQRAVIW
jgi:putative endopeptidase